MPISVTGNEGAIISRPDAVTLHDNYSTLGEGISINRIKSMFFGKQKVLSLLNQTDCSGLRIYFGHKSADDEFEPELILVAIDDDGEDILAPTGFLSEGVPCPKICPINGL